MEIFSRFQWNVQRLFFSTWFFSVSMKWCWPYYVSICQYVWVGCLWLFVNLSSIRLNEFKRIGPNNNNLTTTTTEKLTTTSTWILRSLWWCWSSSSSFLIEIYVDYTCYMMNKINCFVYFLYFQTTTRITPLSYLLEMMNFFPIHSFIRFVYYHHKALYFIALLVNLFYFIFFHYK